MNCRKKERRPWEEPRERVEVQADRRKMLSGGDVRVAATRRNRVITVKTTGTKNGVAAPTRSMTTVNSIRTAGGDSKLWKDIIPCKSNSLPP